jgi:uncharacterized protein
MGMTIVTEFDSDKTRLSDPHAVATERQWATLTHLSGIAVVLGTYLLIFIPILLWWIKREESPFLDDHGKEAVNFQLSMLLYSIVLGLITCGVGAVVFLFVNIIASIIAAVAANRGEFYRYPICIRFLS